MVLPSDLTPDYRWNAAAGSTGRYIDRRGRFVPAAAVNREMEHVIDGTRREMTDLAKQLQRGDIGLQEWYDGMRSKMKILHDTEAAIARGGWAQMTAADWGAVGQLTKQQYDYLNNFAKQIADGLLLDGRFLVRTGMYADAARGTGEDMRRRAAAGKGVEWERRHLGAADHCTDCLEYAGLGWAAIGTLPKIGNSICLTNCHCYFIFGQMIDGEIVEIE